MSWVVTINRPDSPLSSFTLKKIVYLSILLISFSCCSKQENYWIGDWGFIDTNLPDHSNYTEIYIGDTSYIYQNQLGMVWMHGYKVSNDSLYRMDLQKNVLVGKMELQNDSVLLLYNPTGNLKLHKISKGTYYRSQAYNEEAFEQRATVFKSKEEYK